MVPPAGPDPHPDTKTNADKNWTAKNNRRRRNEQFLAGENEIGSGIRKGMKGRGKPASNVSRSTSERIRENDIFAAPERCCRRKNGLILAIEETVFGIKPQAMVNYN